MRNKLYIKRPSRKHTYYYSCQFVGHDRPLICMSHDPEYYNVRDQLLERADAGQLEHFGIEKNTSAIVRRIDIMEKTNCDTVEAKNHLR